MTNGQQKFRGAFITVTSLFFMWGFITVMVDALIPRLKDVFELTYLQAGLVQFAWFTAYGVISIPGGRLIKKMGYKNGIMVGLSLAALGCLIFYPAASTRLFGLFLLALFVVASGITVLQVAANPYISVLGSEEGASSRLEPGPGIQLTGYDHCSHHQCHILVVRHRQDGSAASGAEP